MDEDGPPEFEEPMAAPDLLSISIPLQPIADEGNEPPIPEISELRSPTHIGSPLRQSATPAQVDDEENFTTLEKHMGLDAVISENRRRKQEKEAERNKFHLRSQEEQRELDDRIAGSSAAMSRLRQLSVHFCTSNIGALYLLLTLLCCL